MTATTAYLSRLRAELADVPSDVSREIIAGISEELSGLDADAAAARIRELGDPAFIAAEARAGTAGTVQPVTPITASRGYLIAAGLIVAFGGFIMPVLGFVVGLIMMWQSTGLRLWEKWVATLTVPVTAALFAGLYALSRVVPGIPTHWSIIALVGVVPVITGLWLLWRGLRRTP